MSFETLGLSAELLRAVAATGYENPTPVQREAIPEVLAGRDIMAGAQTGTGKTAAFALPILMRLQSAGSKRGPRAPRVLVLTPTRELAAQVAESFRIYGRHIDVETTVVFGGVNINPQITALRRGVDILVATPGRLLDHAGQRTVDLSRIEALVLDEADRMLDMGFIHDIRRVLKLLPAQRQNLLFSATFPDTILDLCNNMLKSPARIQVARRNATAEGIEQVAHPVDRSRKRDLLASLMADGNWRQVLVFTRTKHGANRLAQQLEQDGFTAAAIHGNKSQAARTKALAGFKSGDVRVLVATDIAARGLDIDQLPHVVNYDLPTVPEDYVHRIGRTGRAGNDGSAVSLVDRDERDLLRAIERLQKREIPLTVVPGFEPGTAAPRDERPPVAAELRDREFNANRGGGRDRSRDRFGGSRDRAVGGRNQQSGQRSGPRPHAGNGSDNSAHRGNVAHRGNAAPTRGTGAAGNAAPRTNAPQAGSPARDAADANAQARSGTRTTRSFRPGRQLRGY